jgi:ADP-ribosylglycohydrolase
MTGSTQLFEQFEGCIFCGAIGDAWGSGYENAAILPQRSTFFFVGPAAVAAPVWSLTDDTWLTLATCEALCEKDRFEPDLLATYFVDYFRRGLVRGAGASTIKALVELEAGIHWRQTGRTGEYAAGNGGAMRIAPLAFVTTTGREEVRAACSFTHRNDEAYSAALAVFLSIRAAITREWDGNSALLELIAPQLPDTRVRDRMLEIIALGANTTIADVAQLGTDGYAPNSVPFAMYAASQVSELGLEGMFAAIIAAGGDTDTNASIAGQIVGASIGVKAIPGELLLKLDALPEMERVRQVIEKCKKTLQIWAA